MKKSFKVLIITAVLLIIPVFPAFAGSISVSTGSVSVAAGSSTTIYLNGTNIAGTYSVYTADGSIAYASGSGWIEGYDATDSVAITISGVAEGNTTVYVEYSVTDIDSIEDYINTVAVSVNVYTPVPVVETEAETESPEPDVEVTIEDSTYTVLKDISDVKLPAGFAVTTITYQDTEIQIAAYTSEESKEEILLFILTDPENPDNKSFYLYDPETGDLTRVQSFSAQGDIYLVWNIPEDYEIPDGFEACELEIGEELIPAFRIKTSNVSFSSFSLLDNETGPTDEILETDAADESEFSDFYFVYCFYDGETSMYCYDAEEETMQRAFYFTTGLNLEKEETETETETEIETETETESSFFDLSNPMTIIVLVFAIIIILLIAALIVVIVVFNSRINRLEYREDDDFYDESPVNDESSAKEASYNPPEERKIAPEDDDFFDDYE